MNWLRFAPFCPSFPSCTWECPLGEVLLRAEGASAGAEPVPAPTRGHPLPAKHSFARRGGGGDKRGKVDGRAKAIPKRSLGTRAKCMTGSNSAKPINQPKQNMIRSTSILVPREGGPKALDKPAQGSALGSRRKKNKPCKGGTNGTSRASLFRPFRALFDFHRNPGRCPGLACRCTFGALPLPRWQSA